MPDGQPAAGKLEGKVAIITGGGSGMGLATAERFLAEGAKVVIADLRREEGEAIAKRLGEGACFAHCDVLSEDAIAATVALAQERFGGLDIMYNNAGYAGAEQSLEEMPVDGWDRTLAVMVRGPMLGIKHSAPAIRARGGGSILITASAAGMRGGLGNAAYAVAKAAVIMLMRHGASELAGDGIRVNAICPGYIATPIFGRAMGSSDEVANRMAPQLAQRFASIQPLPRAGVPNDIAEAALYLASDAAAFVTGIELVVDGGYLVKPVFGRNDPDNPISAMLLEAQAAASA